MHASMLSTLTTMAIPGLELETSCMKLSVGLHGVSLSHGSFLLVTMATEVGSISSHLM